MDIGAKPIDEIPNYMNEKGKKSWQSQQKFIYDED